MNEKVKELIQQKKSMTEELEVKRGQVVELQAKLKELDRERPRLMSATKCAEDDRRTALDRFVLGEVTQNELDEAKRRCEDVKEKEADLIDIQDAVGRRLKQLTGDDIPNLSNALVSTEHKIWREVYDTLKADIQKLAGDKFQRAFAAKLLSGGGSYESFMRDICGTSSTEVHLEYKAKLKEEIEGL